MPLLLYNTLTRRKDVFEPFDPKNVRMYVCGPTVYDFAHIGNARPVIVFDVLYRLLRQRFGAGHVRYVRNITDVDDKINAAAQANGEDIRTLTERTAQAFHEDVAALGCLPPDVEPRATEHIPQMIAMIETLIASNHAYEAEGHVLFAVANDSQYGKLSHRNRDDMIAGARVEVAPYKRDPADFVLWKPSPPDLPGWESPWGRGRPGWHIECSAMSEAYLGQSFDIHGGGLDLIFPHHENEIAQSECAHRGAPFARYWLHNGFVMVDGAKMAKSEGNFRTIREVLAEAPGEAARLMMLKTHYRQPLDWRSDGLREAKADLDQWYRLIESCEILSAPQPLGHNPYLVLPEVISALEDDLNTPAAFRVLKDAGYDALNAQHDGRTAEFNQRVHGLREAGKFVGLFQQNPISWRKGERVVEVHFTINAETGVSVTETVTNSRIDDLVRQRILARKARDFALADSIRMQLAMEGIVLEDKPDGTTEWRRA